jgi:hypothetical protein
MKKFFAMICLLACLGLFSGCAAVLIGAGVAGGVAISDDTVKTNIDSSFNTVWSKSISVIKNMGTIISEDKLKGKAEAAVDSAHVWITVKKLTARATELRVKARKNLLPNIDLAHKISVMITGGGK